MQTSWGEPRSKTVTWYDPMVGAVAGAEMSGLDYLRAMLRGELPPPPIGARSRTHEFVDARRRLRTFLVTQLMTVIAKKA